MIALDRVLAVAVHSSAVRSTHSSPHQRPSLLPKPFFSQPTETQHRGALPFFSPVGVARISAPPYNRTAGQRLSVPFTRTLCFEVCFASARPRYASTMRAARSAQAKKKNPRSGKKRARSQRCFFLPKSRGAAAGASAEATDATWRRRRRRRRLTPGIDRNTLRDADAADALASSCAPTAHHPASTPCKHLRTQQWYGWYI